MTKDFNYLDVSKEETYCIATTTAKFLVPRLKLFKKLSEQKVDKNFFNPTFTEDLEKIIKTFELIMKDDGLWDFTPNENKFIEEGLELFKKQFFNLWW